MRLLDVRDLSVIFSIRRQGDLPWVAPRKLQAVKDVSFSLGEGETLGIVGESGSGKSTLARAMIRMVPATGQALFQGQDLLTLPPRQMQQRRAQIQMVFQDPLASLDPADDRGPDHRRAFAHPSPGPRRRGGEGPGATGDGPRGPSAQPGQPLPARVLRRPVPAHRHRPRADRRAEAPDLRRAGLGTRRLDPGPGDQPARRTAPRARPRDDLHRPRSVSGEAHLRPGDGDVSRPGDGNGDASISSSPSRSTPIPRRSSRRCRSPTPRPSAPSR